MIVKLALTPRSAGLTRLTLPVVLHEEMPKKKKKKRKKGKKSAARRKPLEDLGGLDMFLDLARPKPSDNR